MSIIDTLQNTLSAITKTTLNRYRLDIPSCQSPLDVEDFVGTEAMSELYCYTVHFTSTDKDIEASQLLRKPASLTMGTGLLQNFSEQKVVHGVVTSFERISGSKDQAVYQITLSPFLALLRNQFRTHRFFVNKSVPEVVEQILQDHGFKNWEYEFVLKQTYPKREQINQYQESDLAFIERLLSEMGIFYFFTLQSDTQTEVVHFADKQSAYEFGKTLPLNSPSGMSDSGTVSVWDVSVQHHVVQANVTTKDYNHREAQKVLQSAKVDMSRGESDEVTYGEVYHYKPRHLDTGDKTAPAAETANFLARLDHERFLSAQTTIVGLGNDATLSPGQVLTITETAIVPTLPTTMNNGLLITGTFFSASRKDALVVNWMATPYSETLCWRPALLPRPKVSGTMMARVTSAKSNDIYAWQDTSGLYRVKFDADQDDKAQGQESMPVRLAKPYGGDVYGIHFPLIQGTEVAIAFHDGDPDRPYIAHALHDSRHTDHVTEKNNTRNVIRTPAFNKLRMEDQRGEEHIKLSTEYGGKTQLNLGHNVDAQRNLRGEGAELRTDDWVAVRGGKGVFISADKQPSAGGEMLEMESAISLVKGAVNQVREWGDTTQSHHNLQPDAQSLKDYLNSADQLQHPAMLLNAPKGVGVVSPDVVMLQAGKALYAQSMGEVHIASTKRIALNANSAISLLAQNEGVRLVSGKGPFELESHADVISAIALKDITIQSTQGHLQLTAKNGITLACGGAYIRMSPDGQIEIHGPGLLSLKGNHVLEGPASQDYTLPELPQSVCKECLQKAQQEAVGFVAR